jgi:drug/metabolite transporter (DMT)-like permease
MAAILLALASSITWGTADFMGGIASRRLPVSAVTVWSQVAGFVGLLVVFAAAGGGLATHAVAYGLAAGVGGGLGLAVFYRALALGTMSIVSPIAACGAILPVALALIRGERPATIALAGTVVALVGAVLASVDEHASGSEDTRRSVVLAVAAAIALGLFLYFLGRAGSGGETLSALVGARIGSLVALTSWVAVTRSPLRIARRSLLFVGAVGLVDVTANGLFVLASSRGLLSIVSVLGSLYPVTTLVLAHRVLHERLSHVQKAGIALAITGVALVSAA